MASGGNSLEKGSDVIFQFHCSHCVKDGMNSEAVTFCEGCFDYLCQTCLNTHNRWVAMRGHQLLTIDEIRGKSHIPPTFVRKNCETHGGSLVELYCAEHDTVVCNECCASLTHRSCSLEYLPRVSMNCNAELRSVKGDTKSLKTFCETVENKRLKDFIRLNKENDEIKSECDNVEKDLSHAIHNAVDKLRKKVDSKNTDHMDAIKKDTKILKEAKTFCENYSQTGDENKMQLFLNMQDAKLAVHKYQPMIQEIDKSTGQQTIALEFVSLIQNCLNMDNCIAFFKDEEASLYSEGDVCASVIKGFCQLKDGRIIATDYINYKVKLLDTSYKIKDSIKVSEEPWGVCQVEDDLVAISCGQKIQFVNIKSKSTLKSDINVNTRCRDMTYCGGKLFACCGGFDLREGSPRIVVFNRSGKQIQEINDKGRIGRPFSIAKSEDEQKIFVADNHNGILILNINGQLIDIITHPELKIPVGICVGKAGEVYTFDYCSGKLFKLVPYTKPFKIDEVKVKFQSKLQDAILFDRTRDRLISQASNNGPIEFVNV